ncbi:hypothetical protein [Streptomyces sp. NPDC058755]|uniref:hypothetical protein n=1 Tax=Streptomyces sp. NPDC058755 TaxID=3346624 RepID=UPI0036CB5FAB
MDETYIHVVNRGVAQALEGFVARLSGSGTDWEDIKATYQRIGRGEADEGRSLDSFQAALRLGARVTWRRVSELVEIQRLPPHCAHRVRHDLLTADPAVSPAAVADLARTAQWPLSREIVVVTDHAGESDAVRPIMPPEFLARFDGQPGVIVVPDPEGPGRERAP